MLLYLSAQIRGGDELPDPIQADIPLQPQYKVYTDIEQVQSYLKHSSFQLVSSQEDADILWLYDHFEDFRLVESSLQYIGRSPAKEFSNCEKMAPSVQQVAGLTPVGQPVSL